VGGGGGGGGGGGRGRERGRGFGFIDRYFESYILQKGEYFL